MYPNGIPEENTKNDIEIVFGRIVAVKCSKS